MSSTDPTKPRVVFISGPIDTGPDKSYFTTHYKPPIDTAIASGHNFVIGPITSGIDADALTYLLEYPISPSRITIFMTVGEDKAWGQQFRDKGVNVYVLEDIMANSQNRDAEMTAKSDYDVLRWRTENEAKRFYGDLYREGHLTNTERNWRRRRGIGFGEFLSQEDYRKLGYEGFTEDTEDTGDTGTWRRIKDKLRSR
ncbi:uncharacterized protein APUU_50156A [Aspergillus puulaauensis]|uniref:Uncharacterized protein n=1 Tax=Aspergillus puulaauensis TaxID=1220207 RepID=A0A7R7XPV1_9EURO|nr:uncharacterized protein APUU_50156A [Aspergillus puulaauensis]BCS25445.1 hypothetical protein APUU_50156A [Aspergillus puulaauensis]